MHRLGIDVRIMGKVGDDFLGEMIRQILVRNGRGPAAGMIIDQSVYSSYSVVISPPGIDRSFLHYPGANDTFSYEDVRYNVVGASSLFHFGYPPLMARMYADDGAELEEMYRRAKATGATTSLDMAAADPSSPAGRADWPLILRRTLPHVDVFLPSLEELLFMLRRDLHDRLFAATGGALIDAATPALLHDLSDELLSLGVKVIAIKLGHRGLYLRTASAPCLADMGSARPADLAAWADEEVWAPCFTVRVAGTTGSGDCTIAGFLAALLRELPARQSALMAVAVGACNVEAADALSGIRSWDETTERVAAGWPQHDMELANWQRDPATGVWIAPRSS
jgi:sugar/nucleoside kinase (ribokinase family)